MSPHGGLKGLVHNLLMQFFTLGGSKIEVFETYFVDLKSAGGGGGLPRDQFDPKGLVYAVVQLKNRSF